MCLRGVVFVARICFVRLCICASDPLFAVVALLVEEHALNILSHCLRHHSMLQCFRNCAETESHRPLGVKVDFSFGCVQSLLFKMSRLIYNTEYVPFRRIKLCLKSEAQPLSVGATLSPLIAKSNLKFSEPVHFLWIASQAVHYHVPAWSSITKFEHELLGSCAICKLPLLLCIACKIIEGFCVCLWLLEVRHYTVFWCPNLNLNFKKGWWPLKLLCVGRGAVIKSLDTQIRLWRRVWAPNLWLCVGR